MPPGEREREHSGGETRREEEEFARRVRRIAQSTITAGEKAAHREKSRTRARARERDRLGDRGFDSSHGKSEKGKVEMEEVSVGVRKTSGKGAERIRARE